MTTEFSEKELKEVAQRIAEPAFKYFMKRVNNQILEDKKNGQMSVNEFLSVICAALASVDANALRWMENFYRLKTNEKLDFDKLRMNHTKQLYENLKIILH